MKNEHSPGPWAIGSEYSNQQDELEDADGRTIAVFWTRSAPERATARPQFKDVPQLKANLTLAKAAPELLEALESFLRAPSIGSNGPGSATIVVQEYNVRAAWAAIAKAKGEMVLDPIDTATGEGRR